MKNRSLLIITLALVVTIAAVWIFARPSARMVSGYKAKIACSEIFVAGRDPASVIDQEFVGLPEFLSYFPVKVRQDDNLVTVNGPLGLGKRRAEYREGYGCTLHHDGVPAALAGLSPIAPGTPWPVAGQNAPWPDGVSEEEMTAALDSAFSDNKFNHRGVLVIVDGIIVGERYAPGFSAATPMQSWSIAKSVTATLAGAAAHAGYLDINDPILAPEWAGDPARQALGWDDLMHMTSGLAFNEDYADTKSDANKMLFDARSAAAIAADKPLIHDIGAHWDYSSGTSNILARAIGDALEEEGIDLHSFARDAIFAPIGAASFTLEPDASGDFIGSSFVYATPHDWARLAQLYLDDGLINDTRLLPVGWANFVREPAAHAHNQYGAHFWLNHPDTETGEQRFPGLPETAYSMQGHEGQFVIMIPSERIIIVRLGMTRGTRPWPAIAPLFAEIYAAATPE